MYQNRKFIPMIIIHGVSKYYKQLHQAKPGIHFKMSFVQQEVFADLLLSLDKIRKRLIISGVFEPLKIITLIDLCKVSIISIKKVYKDIPNETTGQSRLEEFLEKMFFQFEFSDHSRGLLLPLYEKCEHETNDVGALEKKAVIWQLLLSKLKLQ
jgi:hypothetical protein